MHRLALAFSLVLAAGGAKANDVGLPVRGATSAEVEPIRVEPPPLAGEGSVKAGAWQGGDASPTLKVEGKGGGLPSGLAASTSGPGNVKGFDGGAVWFGRNLGQGP